MFFNKSYYKYSINILFRVDHKSILNFVLCDHIGQSHRNVKKAEEETEHPAMQGAYNCYYRWTAARMRACKEEKKTEVLDESI